MSDLREIERRLEHGDQRFAEGERHFNGIGKILSDIKAHLGRQDAHLERQDEAIACVTEKLEKVAQGTQDVVTMWNGGVQAVRFFCRCAAAWRFVMREFSLPIVLPILVVGGVLYFLAHGQLPSWMSALFKVIEAL